MKKLLLSILCLFLFSSIALAGDVSRSHDFTDGEVLTAALLDTAFDEIVNEVNDLDGDNLASNIAITTSGNFTLSGNYSGTGNFSTTGTTNTIGNGGSDILNVEVDGGIQFVSAMTWTFTGNQTVSGTWADLGTVTTVDINGGTVDGATLGGASQVTITDADINGGTLDGVVIGGASAAAITGTTLKADTSLELASGATITAILDEDAMGSNSATAGATQQSIKAYVDDNVFGDYSGDGYREAIAATERTTGETGYTKVKEIGPMPRDGTVKVAWEAKVSAGTANQKVYIDGVAETETQDTTETSYTAYSEASITVEKNEFVQIYGNCSPSCTYYCKNLEILVDNPVIPIETSGY